MLPETTKVHNDEFQLVTEFHQKFKIPTCNFLAATVEQVEFDRYRLNFLREELKEYEEALKNVKMEEMLDALVDLVYVAMGTAYLYGWDFREAFNRVHAANMAKIAAASADESKRGHSLDIVKPTGWQAPDLSDLVS